LFTASRVANQRRELKQPLASLALLRRHKPKATVSFDRWKKDGPK
jgi:hypothetical protein